MNRLLLMQLLSALSLEIVEADYIFTVHLVSLHNPGQLLVDSSCCVNASTNQTTCSAPCNTTLRVCLRDEGLDPTDFSCPITELIVAAQDNGEWRVPLPGPWRGTVQLYITVIHDLTGVLGPQAPGNPVVGDLIDSIFIEQLSLTPSRPASPPLNYTGRFGIATAKISFSVACTYQFFGPSCDVFCPLGRNDSLGRYRCDGNGSRTCLEGYEDFDNNCTTCIPADNCSKVGGFCIYPGECICHQGYTGPTCSENITHFITPSPTPSPSSLSLTPSPPSLLSPFSLTLSTLSPMFTLSPPGNQLLTTSRPRGASTGITPTITTTIPMGDTADSSVIKTTPSPDSTAVTVRILEGPHSSSTNVLNISVKPLTPSVTVLEPPTTSSLPLPPPPNPLSVILGTILGVLLLMILISLVVFFISLTITFRRRQENKMSTRMLDIEQRSQSADNVLVNRHVAATHHQDSTSHSDLGHSLEELPETFCNPTYTTFLSDSGTFTQETNLESDTTQEDRVSALEVGAPQKHNLAAHEQSLELKFEGVDTAEMSIGEDLLGSIQQSLSQTGGYNIKRLSGNNEHSDSMDLGSDYTPSFIYTDIFVEEDNYVFRTPSLSPDTEPPPQS